MYAIFTRLSPPASSVRTEQLARKPACPAGCSRARPRTRWSSSRSCSPRSLVGALLGGGVRSATVCEASYSVGGVSPLATRPSCPDKATVAKKAVRKTISATARLVLRHQRAGRPLHYPGRRRPGVLRGLVAQRGRGWPTGEHARNELGGSGADRAART